MKHNTSIEWTHFRREMPDGSVLQYRGATLNPWFGCSKVSPGCAHCYAERMAARLRAMAEEKYLRHGGVISLTENAYLTATRDGRWRGKVGFEPHVLDKARRRKVPTCWFVSMSDPFHETVDHDSFFEFLDLVLATPQHLYILLTKRPAIMQSRIIDARCSGYLSGPIDNLLLGASAENQEQYDIRAPAMKEIASMFGGRRLIWSFEPLLGPVVPHDDDPCSWWIVGGESGKGYRPMRPEWATSLLSQARERNKAFFFKQWGGPTAKSGGSLLDGQLFQEFPRI